ncbi:MAG: sulfite exporter TauE/SafE family protein [Ilumatobacteraceae bacterium]
MSVLVFALVGALAQLIDGTLGMAFGVTSSSLLVALSATPLAASVAVHFAELGTTFAAGASHWRAKNVDWRIVVRLGIPGAFGAALGATVLSRFSLSDAKIWMSWLLLVLGLVLIARFGLGKRLIPTIAGQPTSGLLVPLGAIAGFVDASGGGGWGPITTPTLLSVTTVEPRRVIGTVSASEFLVALAASGGFIGGSATSDLDWKVVTGLLLGGVLMAPFAALLAGRLPHAPFGTLIGGVVVVTNARTIMNTSDVSSSVTWGVLVPVAIVVSLLTIAAWRREKRIGVEHSFFEETAG